MSGEEGMFLSLLFSSIEKSLFTILLSENPEKTEKRVYDSDETGKEI